jgi:hypothetical protein
MGRKSHTWAPLIKSRFFMEEATNFDSERVFTLIGKINNKIEMKPLKQIYL